jgi:CDP-glucose 4,6-dehydratase
MIIQPGRTAASRETAVTVDGSMAVAREGALPDSRFWAGKRVFLTGHTGFKGSWLALWLKRLGAVVTGYALAPDTDPNLCTLAGLESGLRAMRGDIRHGAALEAAMAVAAPDIVLHLAAQPLVRRSYADPVLTFETNVLGTVNLLQAIRRTPSVACAVVVTTDKCYENLEREHAYREGDALGGHDPYSASKACAELAVAAWRRSFFTPAHPGERVVAVASARAGNVIGGGDWAEDRLLPDCIRAFAAGTPVSIRNPHSTRPWQHVLDPLCGYLLLAERLWLDGAAHAMAWNFGPAIADSGTVGEVVDRLAACWGGGASRVADTALHQHEAGLLAVNATLARSRLEWRARLGLNEAIEWTARWYKRQWHGADAAALMAEDIARYEGLAAP